MSLTGSIRLSTISSSNGLNHDGDDTSYCSSIAVMSPDQGCKFPQQRPPSVASGSAASCAAAAVRSGSRPGSATSGAMNRASSNSYIYCSQHYIEPGNGLQNIVK